MLSTNSNLDPYSWYSKSMWCFFFLVSFIMLHFIGWNLNLHFRAHAVCIVQRNFTHLIRCQTKSEAIHNIKEEDKNKVLMNKPYNIPNTNICNGIFHISFFKALLLNEGKRESGRNDSGGVGGAKRPGTVYLLIMFIWAVFIWIVQVSVSEPPICIFINRELVTRTTSEAYVYIVDTVDSSSYKAMSRQLSVNVTILYVIKHL
jgi:hypothetical protein